MSASCVPSRSSECLVVGLAAFVLAILALVPAPAEGQTAYGGLVGLVRDAQGGVLPGATVTIINTGTNLKRETVSDAQGAYNFVNVLAGPYDVRIAMPSFREAVRTGVPVT